MSRKYSYHEKSNPLLNLLYIVVALALIAALFLMYRHNQTRQLEYEALVSQASETERIAELQARTIDIEEELEADAAVSGVPVATAVPVQEEPSAEPAELMLPEALPDTPEESEAPAEGAPTVSLPALSVPDDALIGSEESLFN